MYPRHKINAEELVMLFIVQFPCHSDRHLLFQEKVKMHYGKK